MAFVFGSVAKKSDTVTSDIDVMVIREEPAYADLFAALEESGRRLGRAVSLFSK